MDFLDSMFGNNGCNVDGTTSSINPLNTLTNQLFDMSSADNGQQSVWDSESSVQDSSYYYTNEDGIMTSFSASNQQMHDTSQSGGMFTGNISQGQHQMGSSMHSMMGPFNSSAMQVQCQFVRTFCLQRF